MRPFAAPSHAGCPCDVVVPRHCNLHADSLVLLQAMHEAAKSDTSGGGSGNGSGTLRRARSMSTLLLEQVTQAYNNLHGAWNVYQPHEELARMGVPNSQWRVSSANANYELSPTYPAVLCVPASIDDQHLAQGASFRSKRRLPVLSWRHPVNGATITRCSQPMVGLGNSRSPYDEAMLEAIRQASKSPAMRLLITDARPKLNARANKTQGKGFENTGEGSAYPNCDLVFCNIGNIHVMRKCLDSLRAVCNTPSGAEGVGRSLADDRVALEVAQTWLSHVSRVMTAAASVVQVCVLAVPSGVVVVVGWLGLRRAYGFGCCSPPSRVQAVDQGGVSSLIHCSDGWDRTAQLCALSELLMDPFYRTLRGFQVLVEREWVSFGHKFADRCGWNSKGFQSSERSPIFLQFLDCVHQCMLQVRHVVIPPAATTLRFGVTRNMWYFAASVPHRVRVQLALPV